MIKDLKERPGISRIVEGLPLNSPLFSEAVTLLQKLITYPRLCNLIVRKANSVKYIQQLLVQGLASVDKRKSILTNPKFYFNLFLTKKKDGNSKAA